MVDGFISPFDCQSKQNFFLCSFVPTILFTPSFSEKEAKLVSKKLALKLLHSLVG